MEQKDLQRNSLVIAESVRKIMAVFFMVAMALVLRSVQGTNAFFFDTVTLTTDSAAAGFWEDPSVTVSSPSSSSIWQAGSTHAIQWTAESADPDATDGMLVDIEYSCDDGATWDEIADDEENDGSYSWTVPEDISDDCKIKVEAEDSHGLSGDDESGEFEIAYLGVLNEFIPNPEGEDAAQKPGGEWVELYNNSEDDTIDLVGYYLTDADGGRIYVEGCRTDTGGTSIAPQDFLVVYRKGTGDDCTSHGFSLNDGGDTLSLYSNTGHLVDRYVYNNNSTTDSDSDEDNTPGSDNSFAGTELPNNEGKSWARDEDGTGDWVDPVPTPGKKNTISNDMDDFRKYYRKACFTKKNKPNCDEKFLKSLGLLKDGRKVDQEDEKEEPKKEEAPPSGETGAGGTAGGTVPPVAGEVKEETNGSSSDAGNGSQKKEEENSQEIKKDETTTI